MKVYCKQKLAISLIVNIFFVSPFITFYKIGLHVCSYLTIVLIAALRNDKNGARKQGNRRHQTSLRTVLPPLKLV